ncbi:hypothetical protein, partial [Pseudomonas sp. R25(2017)]|uniref:hypothetical protein n=1 Tax=Pseudomonas sp. R25(2017) TaxID=1981696 RepID=UPI001C45633F
GFCGIQGSLVGASLLAMAVAQSTEMLAVPASSLASQLPQVLAVYMNLANAWDTCGSWLASDGGRSGNGDVG